MIAEGEYPFIVRPDGESQFELIADMRDIRQWEKISPRNTLHKLATNPSAEDYYSLAHTAIRRQCLRTVPSYSEFVETTVVAPNNAAVAQGKLDFEELVVMLEKAMSYEEATPHSVADAVVEFLAMLAARDQTTDPTRPAH